MLRDIIKTANEKKENEEDGEEKEDDSIKIPILSLANEEEVFSFLVEKLNEKLQ